MLDYYAQWCASSNALEEAIFKPDEVLGINKI
jgi:thiol:disulfide interchange protein